MSEAFSGWGHTHSVQCTELTAKGPLAVAEVIRQSGRRGVVPRGGGRAYGDAALNSGGELLSVQGGAVRLDPGSGLLDVAAGMSMGQVLERVVPAGWMPPALPGTRHVTVGGAVAADVHGKDQRNYGAVGGHLRAITLVDGRGQLRSLGPDSDPDAFWATVGGMGLTGVITHAQLQLSRIETSALRVRTERLQDLDSVLAAMDTVADERYCVAWLDAAGGRRGASEWAGRGVVEWADHARPDELPPRRRSAPLAYRTPRAATVPPLPASVVSARLVRRYNAIRFARTAAHGERITALSAYFHQLDAMNAWYRLYGPYGLCQYHVLIPPSQTHLIRHVIERLQQKGIPPLLAVLKRHGPGDPAPLTFPGEGWGLALDLPGAHPQVEATLCGLDETLAAAGGRVYLAKDSMLRSTAFAAMYPRLGEWRSVRERLDPDGRLRSDLGRRLGLSA